MPALPTTPMATAAGVGRRMRARIPIILSSPGVRTQLPVAATNEATGAAVVPPAPTCFGTHSRSMVHYMNDDAHSFLLRTAWRIPGSWGIAAASFSTDAVSTSAADDGKGARHVDVTGIEAKGAQGNQAGEVLREIE